LACFVNSHSLFLLPSFFPRPRIENGGKHTQCKETLFYQKEREQYAPPPESNHRIKALASLLVATTGNDYNDCNNCNDNYDNYECKGNITGEEIVRSGIARGKPESFKTKQHDDNNPAGATAAAATSAAATSTSASVAKADNAASNAPTTATKRDGAAETAAFEEQAEEEALAAAKSHIACLCSPLGGSNDGKELLCLISRGCGHDKCQSLNQSRALGWLASRGVPHAVVDGTDPSGRDLQERLFAISGTRGGYPQFFVVKSTSSSGKGSGGVDDDGGCRDIIVSFGNFNRMEMLNKTSSLPPEVLATHPKLMMWEDICFGMTAAPPPAAAATTAPTSDDRVEAAGGGTVVAVSLTEVPASVNICTEMTTATEATTATETAMTATKMTTGHPPLDSPPPRGVRWHLDQMGVREGKRPEGGGGGQWQGQGP
jgi:hypothetical protein